MRIYLCSHLGSNQGPKDYESDGRYLITCCKNVVSSLQKQFIQYFSLIKIWGCYTIVTYFVMKMII